MKPQPKKKTPRDRKYLAFIRKMPCEICKTTINVQAHHTETGGVSLKGSDYSAVALCFPKCHGLMDQATKRGIGIWPAERLNQIIRRNLEAYKMSGGIIKA